MIITLLLGITIAYNFPLPLLFHHSFLNFFLPFLWCFFILFLLQYYDLNYYFRSTVFVLYMYCTVLYLYFHFIGVNFYNLVPMHKQYCTAFFLYCILLSFSSYVLYMISVVDFSVYLIQWFFLSCLFSFSKLVTCASFFLSYCTSDHCLFTVS